MIRTKYGYVSTTEARCCGELDAWIKQQRQKNINRNRRSQKKKRKGLRKHGKNKAQ
ncbi:MAG: hypothetical protein SOH70_05095 [Lentilactobacillus sunkii]